MKGRCQQLTDSYIYTTVRMGIANSFCATEAIRSRLVCRHASAALTAAPTGLAVVTNGRQGVSEWGKSPESSCATRQWIRIAVGHDQEHAVGYDAAGGDITAGSFYVMLR